MRDELRCGECGESTFRIEHAKAPDDVRVGGHAEGIEGYLIVICVNCLDESFIKPIPTHVDVQGNLCGGWGPKESKKTDEPKRKK